MGQAYRKNTPAAQPDDRRSERLPINLKARCRTSSWQVADAVLANVSSEGCCLTVARDSCSVGQPVLIRAGSAKRIPGTVRWTLPQRVGVEFDIPLDPAALSDLLAWTEGGE
jgi:hypothetical protein